jgi:hypothetical protein
MPTRADLVRYEPLRAEIHRAFWFWNQRCWEGKLPEPVFNFHPQPPNGRVLGHFRAAAWSPGDKRSRDRDEIVFFADLCLERGMVEVIATLVHEMIHLWQHVTNTGSRFGHHNRKFHAEARRVGFKTTKGDYQGHTEPASEFKAAVTAFSPKLTGIPFRSVARQKGALVKWTCNCGFAVRVAVERFNATCDTCHTKFKQC